MKNAELFKACAAQCVWCKEQWGIVRVRQGVEHVGPFTLDPHLFSHPCAATPIRTAFDYFDYRGGKQIKWKARSAKTLFEIITGRHNKNGGFTQNVMSPDNRAFWRGGCTATLEVASWPEWKQSLDLYGKRCEPVSAERLQDTRNELLFYDECDFAVRQPCTENLQYRPKLDRNWNEPTCNSGMGCSTCWERYERAVKEWNDKNPCCY